MISSQQASPKGEACQANRSIGVCLIAAHCTCPRSMQQKASPRLSSGESACALTHPATFTALSCARDALKTVSIVRDQDVTRPRSVRKIYK